MADNDMATRKDHRNNAGCVPFGCDYGHHNAGCALSTQPAPAAHRDCPAMTHEFRRGTCVRFFRVRGDEITVQGMIRDLTFENSFPTYSIVSHAEEDDGKIFENVWDGWITDIVDDSTAYDD